MDAYSTKSVNIHIETFNAYQYRIFKLDFRSYNLHISFDFRDLVEGILKIKHKIYKFTTLYMEGRGERDI